MSDVENARAHAEAMNEPVSRSLRSARRAQLWAGLNRYLASEAKGKGTKVPEQKTLPRAQDPVIPGPPRARSTPGAEHAKRSTGCRAAA